MLIKKILILPFLIVVIMMSSCSRGPRSSGRARHSRPAIEQNNHRSNERTMTRTSNPKNDTSSKEGREMTAADIFEKYNMAVFTIFTSDGFSGLQGSGFFISSDGLAVSNYHVFKGTYKGLEKIKLADGSIHELSEVVAYSENDDIFVFKVEGNSYTSIPISKRKVRVGEKAYAIGSPRGLENTFSSGEISQLRDGFIQISVPIDHGSSGGVLLNSYGEAIGITTAGYDNSGANLNFAVDIHVLEKYIH